MGIAKRYSFFLSLIFCVQPVRCALWQANLAPQQEVSSASQLVRNWRFKHKQALKKKGASIKDLGFALRDLAYDAFRLHGNLISWDSFKIFSSMFPLYIASRMVDNRLQDQFYDYTCHKNINQLPNWCHDFAENIIGVPIVLLGMQAFISRNHDLQQTSRMYLLGMPFVIFGKDIIKKIEWDFCQRPWHEKFSCEKRAHGGFPSGHIAEATFTTVLYGSRYGAKAAVPLSLLTATIGITFLNCNRHYLSQLLAGAGLGAMYAFAANKVIDSRLRDDMHMNFAFNEYGAPTFGFSYRF